MNDKQELILVFGIIAFLAAMIIGIALVVYNTPGAIVTDDMLCKNMLGIDAHYQNQFVSKGISNDYCIKNDIAYPVVRDGLKFVKVEYNTK